MATDVQPTEAPKHVPAWKRLGLKLKYAKDTPDPAPESNVDVGKDTTVPEKTQPHELGKRAADDESLSVPSSKRQKSEAKRGKRKQAAVEAAGLGISTHQIEPTTEVNESSRHVVSGDAEVPAEGKQLQRRKSVTFTPDTKQEDGFSAAKIFKSSLPPGHPRAIASSETDEPAKQDDTSSPASPKEAKKPKKAKKAKSIASPSPTSNTTLSSDKSGPAYLQYLQQYHTDRANWKFNTNKQQLLFKHAFDTHRIPPAYTPALVEYISGLKSPRPRQQLAREADAILADCYRAHGADDGPAAADLAMESPAARQAAYHAALERAQAGHRARGGTMTAWDLDQAAEIANEIERASRAEQVLYEALMAHLHPEVLAEQQEAARAAAKEAAGKEKPMKKSRKARTEVSSSEESSSSSSSSSSSESSSESESESDSDSDESDESDDGDAKAKASAGRTPKAAKRQPIFGKQLLDNVFGKKGGADSSSEASSDEGSDADDESD